MMFTVNRRPGHPIDRTAVLVDLPHAAHIAARPWLCSLMTADTHEPITGVLGASMHFDNDPTPGNYELWIVAEQIVDENNNPLPIGTKYGPEYHHEYFGGTLRTALFRYRVAGFTTGPTLDRAATWHHDVADESTDEVKPATNLTVFEVRFRLGHRERVAAHFFEFRDGFVTFLANGSQAASFPATEVVGITNLPEVRAIVVNREQLRVLRSAALWDVERTAPATEPSEYRQQLLDTLAQVLGMMPPADDAPTTEQVTPVSDGYAPNKRTREAARRLDDLVKRA